MKKKEYLKYLVLCFTLLFLVFHTTSSGLAGEFNFEEGWGLMCTTIFPFLPFWCPPDTPYAFWGTSSIAVDSHSGKIYVGDFLNARVHKYNIDGSPDGMLTACYDWNANSFTYCIDEGEANYTPRKRI